MRANAAPAAEYGRTLSLFSLTDDTSPRQRAAAATVSRLSPPSSPTPTRYTLHAVATTPLHAEHQWCSANGVRRRRRRHAESPVSSNAGMIFPNIIEGTSLCTYRNVFREFIVICIWRFNLFMITLFLKLEELNTKRSVGIFCMRVCNIGYHEISRFSGNFGAV